MFMNTMAVGPLDPLGTSGLSGAIVAFPRRHCSPYACRAGVDIDEVARFAARARGARRAIITKKVNSKSNCVKEAWY
jgi:hypothetical protein